MVAACAKTDWREEPVWYGSGAARTLKVLLRDKARAATGNLAWCSGVALRGTFLLLRLF